jgi:hypothetical protein
LPIAMEPTNQRATDMSSTLHRHHQIAEPRLTEVSEGILAYIQPDGSNRTVSRAVRPLPGEHCD